MYNVGNKVCCIKTITSGGRDVFIDGSSYFIIHSQKGTTEIFIEDGEPAFRLLEVDVVRKVLADFDGVISLGGGAPINKEIQEVLQDANYPVVFIDVSIAQAATRIGFNKDRPLLLVNPRQQWISLMNDRRPIYEKLASQTISSDNQKPHEVAKQISDKLKATL